jgi:predicted metal-dependent peptidase
MFANFISSQSIPCAATDGRDIYLNPEFISSLPSEQQDGAILHEILHAALLHPLRLKEREPKLWNIAADIVVNGMISQQQGFDLPPGGLRDENLEHLSVEAVYEILRSTGTDRFDLAYPDLLTGTADNGVTETTSGNGAPPARRLSQHQDSLAERLHQRARTLELTAYWKQALQHATASDTTSRWGKLALGIERELESSLAPQLDWRSYLWRYLVRTPTDFQGFDRRFIGRGLYLEALENESVRVYVAIDTSGSVSDSTLQLFIDEVKGIIGAYPHLVGNLYYVDRDAYGPYPLTNDSPLPSPQGGGGTSFVAFFDRVAQTCDEHTQSICIYLTDGYGEFPIVAPSIPTLWVVTPTGLDLAQFPFGEAVRLPK